ncbi:MAG TPA: L,D-transpeptidase family protein [Trebonia sp.]|nr:L,D-transpeptidase family protein [Trebonia sp.]
MSLRKLIRHRGVMGTASAAVAVLIAGGVFAAVSPGNQHESMASAANTQPVATHSAKPAATPKPVAPLQILSVTPSSASHDANGATPIKITFNEALAATTALPTLSPNIAGSWTVSGDTATFQPKVGFSQNTHVTVTIPGGSTGVEAAGLTTTGTTTTAATDAGLLPKTAKLTFTTGSFSTLRLQQLLTQLGYLPMTWTATDPTAAAIPAGDANAQLSAAYAPPAGSFTFDSGYPSKLTSQWSAGQSNMLDNGAIRAFENDNDLTMDGQAGPEVWSSLLKAVADNKQNKNGYTYSLVNQASPETLKVYHDGKLIEDTPVNTGVPGAGTQDGTFPVYERFQVTEMKGTDVDGTKYDDTVYWVSYFNGGDALHYYPRPGYGYYQSNGCVEMQLDPAKYIWQYTTYGSLVTVYGPVA